MATRRRSRRRPGDSDRRKRSPRLLRKSSGCPSPSREDCLAIVPERKRADRGGQIQRVEATLYGRGVPLAAGALILCPVLLPEVIRLLATPVSIVSSKLPGSWPPYDTLAAAFVVAYGFLLGMASLALAQLRHLWQQRSRLRQADA